MSRRRIRGLGGATLSVLRTARAKPLGAIGAIVVLVAAFLAVFGPLIAPFDPLEPHYDNLFEEPGGRFLLGTDNFGRDQLSRLIVGARPVTERTDPRKRHQLLRRLHDDAHARHQRSRAPDRGRHPRTREPASPSLRP